MSVLSANLSVFCPSLPQPNSDYSIVGLGGTTLWADEPGLEAAKQRG